MHLLVHNVDQAMSTEDHQTFRDRNYMCNIVQGLKYMAKEEGIRGMFRGNWTNCVRIIPNSAVKFLTYEQLSR